jgi:hypothetical protein
MALEFQGQMPAWAEHFSENGNSQIVSFFEQKADDLLLNGTQLLAVPRGPSGPQQCTFEVQVGMAPEPFAPSPCRKLDALPFRQVAVFSQP